MPAKLTEEEKAVRKIATSLRDKAHSERMKEYREMKAAAYKAIKEGPLGEAVEAACEAQDLIMEAYRNDFKALQTQIDALQQIIKDRQTKLRADLGPARAAKDAAWSARQVALDAAESELDERFPDLQGQCWISADAWKQIDEFMPQAMQVAAAKR